MTYGLHMGLDWLLEKYLRYTAYANIESYIQLWVNTVESSYEPKFIKRQNGHRAFQLCVHFFHP